MKRLFVKVLACVCLISNLFIPEFTVQASSLGNTDLSDTDLTLGQVNNNDCIVDVDVGSHFTITLPKRIMLSGSDGLGSYDITVKGDIGARRRVSVVPDEKFNLSSNGKADVETMISQPKRVFDYSEISVVDATSQLVGTTTTGTVNAGNLSKGVWSGTFNFNVSTYEYAIIGVEAQDGATLDLNAKSYTILNEQKREDLLDSLVASGVVAGVTKEDIDAIIEVESDSFNGFADTTFYVSSIAQDGDTVIILHFNESNQQWELIAVDTVVDGKVGGTFVSYSPVAFIVIPQDNSGGNIVIPETGPEPSPASYFTTDGAGTITGLTDEGKAATDIVIPSSINGEAISKIGQMAFYENTKLKSVYIKSGITNINGLAFDKCSNIESVTLPSTLESIGNNAFSGCSKLTDINLPRGLKIITDGAFASTAVKKVVIPNTVVTISCNVFNNCKDLEEVTIPESVTTIGNNAFNGCSNLKYVELPSSISTVSLGLFQKCSSLSKVILPSSITNIQTSAFQECTALTSIDFIPTSVTTLETSVFKGCTGLVDVEIPNHITEIKPNAFQECTGLQEIVIPSSVKSIGSYAFWKCNNLADITVMGSLDSIGGNAFLETPWLDSSKANNTLVVLGSTLIDGKSARGVIAIPEGITSISDYALQNCATVTSVQLPSTLVNIGIYSFAGCTGLTEIILPTGVKTIGGQAFNGCSNLSKIVIPATVEDIQYKAFIGCSNLNTVNYRGTVEQWDAILIDATGNDPLNNATKVYNYRN